MNEIINNLIQNEKFLEYQNMIDKKTSPISILGLVNVAKSQFVYSTQMVSNKRIFVITYNEIQAKRLLKDLKYFYDNVIYMPKKEIVTYDYLTESKDLPFERIDCLNNIYSNKAQVIITTIEACLQDMIIPNDLYKNVLKFKIDGEYKFDEIKEKLILLGYERSELIEGRGQFSVRGDIIDIAITDKKGVRIEFWGDTIDSIRYYYISSQRSIEEIKSVVIYPAHEYLLLEKINNVCDNIIEKYNDDLVNSDIEQIKLGNYLSKIDKFISCFYNNTGTFLDYINKDDIVVIDEESKIKARENNILKDNSILLKALLEKNKIIPEILVNLEDNANIEDKIIKNQLVYLESQNGVFNKPNTLNFNYSELNFYRSSIDLMLDKVKEGLDSNKSVLILGGTEENSRRISLLLLEKDIPHKFIKNLDNIKEKNKVIISTGILSSGFECFDTNLVVISGEELFSGSIQKRKRVHSEFKKGESIVFSDLKEGDYIVHKNHGIGQFIGINTIKTGNVIKDYIKIRYKGDDILYVPTDALDNVKKYIGGGEEVPRLNKLGSKEWENTKRKVKSNLREIAKNLIELYAKRKNAKGFIFSKDTPWQKEFEEKFPYTETDDQLRCIEELKQDMEKATPMDRLLCGDVGYGKTEVAIRGAFKAVMDQKQVAYLVPTTVLANQQYETFKERMKDFPIKIEVLNRFKTKKEQEEIIKKLKLGEIDIIIGTHRILSKDVEFKDLGFLIIDEEHRFGVKDKEKIKELKTSIDVLTMTATPIPRTLHMSIVGIRDMSVIYQPPQNRRPVQTYVLEYDSEVVKEAITKELERNGQVFYLFNNVEKIIGKSEKIQRLVPDAKVAFAHGKMTGRQLEDIMQDFIDKKIDVLVCTTILESGIDIPNANTIIVENAERLGLAQLYQIRGRVGRSQTQAYAYITYRSDKLLSEVADKRLKAIKEFTEFGSGFKIAMRDLEIRGAGSLVGEIQHGHMDQVGYDTYCKLLDEVVKDIQGIQVKEELDVQIDLNVSSYIEDSYISNNAQKIEVYQNIALAKSEDDISDVIDEVTDRYGNMPKEMENLLEIARIKMLCKEKNIFKVQQKNLNIVFYFIKEQFNMEIVDKLVSKYKNFIRFSAGAEPYITLKLKSDSSKTILDEVKKFLKEL